MLLFIFFSDFTKKCLSDNSHMTTLWLSLRCQHSSCAAPGREEERHFPYVLLLWNILNGTFKK